MTDSVMCSFLFSVLSPRSQNFLFLLGIYLKSIKYICLFSTSLIHLLLYIHYNIFFCVTKLCFLPIFSFPRKSHFYHTGIVQYELIITEILFKENFVFLTIKSRQSFAKLYYINLTGIKNTLKPTVSGYGRYVFFIQ